MLTEEQVKSIKRLKELSDVERAHLAGMMEMSSWYLQKRTGRSWRILIRIFKISLLQEKYLVGIFGEKCVRKRSTEEELEGFSKKDGRQVILKGKLTSYFSVENCEVISELIEAINPYLVSKKAQSEKLKAFINTNERDKYDRKRLSEEAIQLRLKLIRELKEINLGEKL